MAHLLWYGIDGDVYMERVGVTVLAVRLCATQLILTQRSLSRLITNPLPLGIGDVKQRSLSVEGILDDGGLLLQSRKTFFRSHRHLFLPMEFCELFHIHYI